MKLKFETINLEDIWDDLDRHEAKGRKAFLDKRRSVKMKFSPDGWTRS